MQEAEWLAATNEIRQVFGGRMTTMESFELVDVFVPVGRTGLEVLVGVDESHVPSEQRDAMYTLQETMATRIGGDVDVVGVFVSAEPLPPRVLAKALGRMGTNEGVDKSVIPLTLEQAQQVCSLDVDLFDLLEPMFELVEVAASRTEDDLSNAADELLTNIAILVERYRAEPLPEPEQ